MAETGGAWEQGVFPGLSTLLEKGERRSQGLCHNDDGLYFVLLVSSGGGFCGACLGPSQ